MDEKAFIIGDIVERKDNTEPIEWLVEDDVCQ
jgi:hypothetical protein